MTTKSAKDEVEIEEKMDGSIEKIQLQRKVRRSRHEQKKLRKKAKKAKQQNSQGEGFHEETDKVINKSSNKNNSNFTVFQEPIEYKASFIPTEFKERALQNTKQAGNKWFPKAVTLKSQPGTKDGHTSILLFYQYVSPIPWSENQVQRVLQLLQCIWENRPNLGGRIRVAPEGLNCTLSAADTEHNCGATTLRHFALDLQHHYPVEFQSTDFKYHDNLTADRHFKDLKLLPVKELVFYNLSESEAPLDKTGVHLEPREFHQMLKQPDADTVVIDVRNHYEAAIGRFDGQMLQSSQAAEYLDPKMRKSTDFKSWLAQPPVQQQLAQKKVMLYCTGGVRCERASAYLNNVLGDQVKGVYQLQGGIERYMKEIPPSESCWRGKNFVFDKREAVSATHLNGDGGVLKTTTKTTPATNTLGKCSVCQKPWDRYVGKRKCTTCGVPVLVCDTCLTHAQASNQKCPLCVDQNVQVPADQVKLTDNGTRSKSLAHEGTAAPSVLKWGGGHSNKRKRHASRL